MPLVRLPFAIIELHDPFDVGRPDERPPTRPGKGGFRKVRGPRKGQS